VVAAPPSQLARSQLRRAVVSASCGRMGPAGSILWCSEPPGRLARSPLTRAASVYCGRTGPAGSILWWASPPSRLARSPLKRAVSPSAAGRGRLVPFCGARHRRAGWLGRRCCQPLLLVAASCGRARLKVTSGLLLCCTAEPAGFDAAERCRCSQVALQMLVVVPSTTRSRSVGPAGPDPRCAFRRSRAARSSYRAC